MTVEANDETLQYRVRAIDRAIDILKAFTHQEPDLSLAQIVARTGLSKPTAFRLLATMKQRGLIQQRPATGAYSLGSEIAALAAVRSRQSGLLDISLPAIRKIRDSVNETVSLVTRAGDFRIQLYQLESLHAVHRSAPNGERTPLHAGAANKLLLASMDDSEIADYLRRIPLVAFTPATITDHQALWMEIQAIRVRGYSESFGEKYFGGMALALPIRDAIGAVVAALSVSVPEQRYTDELRKLCMEELTRGAREISRELGYRG